MQNISDRLKYLLEKEGVSAIRFAEKIGVQRSSVSHILSGRNNPGLEFIQKILSHFPHISPDWLITGNGSFNREETVGKVDEIKDKAPNLFSGVKDEDPSPYITKNTGETDKRVDKIEGKQDNKSQTGATMGKKIEKIIVFYTDQTFNLYTPNNE